MVKTEAKNARGRQNTALLPQITRVLFPLALAWVTDRIVTCGVLSWPGTFLSFLQTSHGSATKKTTALLRTSRQLSRLAWRYFRDLPTI